MSRLLTTLLTECPNLQADLNTSWGIQKPVEPLPFLEFVGANTPLNQLVSPGKGKTRTVQLTYTKDVSESEVVAGVDNPVCVASTERGNEVATYSINTEENLKAEEIINSIDLQKACIDNPFYFMSRVNALVRAVDEAIATKTASQLTGLTGLWASDVAVTSERLIVKTLKDSSQDPYAQTLGQIKMALRQTGFNAGAAIFGGTTLNAYYMALQAGCCANSGIDLSKELALYGEAFAYDRRVATALGGQDYNIAIAPGALKLLQYTASPWKFGMDRIFADSANYTSAVITSPATGVNMDLYIKEDCGVVSISVIATTKLVGLPDDMFPSGHVYEGVNFVNQIKVTNV